MRKIVTIFAALVLMITSCNETDLTNTCSVLNPVEDLGWLKSEVQQYEQSNSDLKKYMYIAQGSYKRETVFIFGNCCPNCNSVVPVKNCVGETIGYLGHGDEDIDPEIFNEAVIIWHPENFACKFK